MGIWGWERVVTTQVLGHWPSICKWPGWGASFVLPWWGMYHIHSKAPPIPPTKAKGAAVLRTLRSGINARWVVHGLPQLLQLTSCTGGARGFLNSDKETGKENLARTDGRS